VPQGLCALCHQERELQKSHYIPAGLYARTGEPSLPNPNPVIISKGVMLQTSDQLWAHLLCAECEELFNKNGEDWVLARVPQSYNAPFPLREALRPEEPIAIGDGFNVYAGASIKSFDMDRIVYFGISIFWRGAVCEWKDRAGATAPPVALCGYEEPVRRFLRGDAFPKDMFLEVFLCAYEQVWPSMWLPDEAHLPERQRYWFYMAGLIYILNFGAGTPEITRRRCAYNSTKRIVMIDTIVSESVRTKMSKKMKESRPVKKFADFLSGPDPRKKK
jgi:hypothetical protein